MTENVLSELVVNATLITNHLLTMGTFPTEVVHPTAITIAIQTGHDFVTGYDFWVYRRWSIVECLFVTNFLHTP
jgi:hypothetical protein